MLDYQMPDGQLSGLGLMFDRQLVLAEYLDCSPQERIVDPCLCESRMANPDDWILTESS